MSLTKHEQKLDATINVAKEAFISEGIKKYPRKRHQPYIIETIDILFTTHIIQENTTC